MQIFSPVTKVKVSLFCFLLLTAAAGSSSTQHAYSSEQRVFSAEDTQVKRPVELSRDVLALLQKDKLVQSVMENQDPPAENLPPSWFSASAVHLSSARSTDLIVVGQPPVSGGNVAMFWVFCATDHGYELVMTAPAHALRVKNTRWKGHRDIELTSMTVGQISTVLCRYDGKQYVKYKTRSEKIE
jgi:hypothetical protein